MKRGAGRILSVRIGEKARRAGEAPYPALRELIGIVAEGPANLSVRSGDKVRRLLRARETRHR